MKTLTLTLRILLITISCSLSEPYHQNGGFTTDLIERDSPLSPLYNPTSTRFNRVQNAFLRSIYRASLLSKRAGFTSKIEAAISGDQHHATYLMTIKIGTPPVPFIGIADTGADLTWAQCQPCKACYKQTGAPILVPSNSSTYQQLTCDTKYCAVALYEDERSCDSENMCHYKTTYGYHGTYSMGDLAVDTFRFGQTQLENVVFGCGHENKGDFNDTCASGIISLGGGALSLVNQLESVIKGKFSYCLIPYSDNSNQTSTIHFGDDADVSGEDVVWTPLVKKYPPAYYYVTLQDVYVEKDQVSRKQSSNKSAIVGNVIFDSGTTLTFLPEDFYLAFVSDLRETVHSNLSEPCGLYELCYENLWYDGVPMVLFRFDGADMYVPPENLFWEVEPGVSCLTVRRSEGLSIIGNLLQRNMLMGFDLVNQRVSFRSADCTQNK